MSDTPRTDAVARMPTDAHPTWVVPVDFARQLERELAACQKNELDWAASSDSYAEHYREERSRRVQLQQAVQERDAELAQLREDKKRLDWLEWAMVNSQWLPRHDAMNAYPDSDFAFYGTADRKEPRSNLRAAIDDARKATP